jgi:hypothetical protein
LPTMGTLNLWTENGVLESKVHVRSAAGEQPVRDE